MPLRLQALQSVQALSPSTSTARIPPPAQREASALLAESARALLSKSKTAQEQEQEQDRFDRMQEKQPPTSMQLARRIEGQARWT